MTAKIKDRYKHSAKDGHPYKPKGVSNKAFEKAYWPFLPLLIAIALLAPMAAKSGAFKHPFRSVLSYATSTNPQQLLTDTNAQRLAGGEATLNLSQELSAAAQSKAEDMAGRNYWSHSTPEGIEPWAFVTDAGYEYQKLGENLAAGFSNDSEVVKAWMASPHHRDNILDASYTEVGFGYANSPNFTAAGGSPTTIVVAFYGRPSTTIVPANSNRIGLFGTPNTAGNFSGSALAGTTTRAQLSTSSRIASWLPVIIISSLATVLVIWAGHHLLALRKLLREGRRYAYRHPLTEMGLIVVASLLFILTKTAGYIQ